MMRAPPGRFSAPATSVSSAIVELTAQMKHSGGGGSPDDSVRRRRLAKDVRAVREKLTSSIGLERAFDYELIRLFAQYRLGASFPLFVLALAIAAASSIWTPLRTTGIWFVVVLSAIALMLILAQSFLRQDPDSVPLPSWRRRFILGELLQGGSWALVVQALAEVETPGAQSFVLFVLLMLPP
jgi:two-component system cell cycle sensor histidine kinase PleC